MVKIQSGFHTRMLENVNTIGTDSAQTLFFTFKQRSSKFSNNNNTAMLLIHSRR